MLGLNSSFPYTPQNGYWSQGVLNTEKKAEFSQYLQSTMECLSMKNIILGKYLFHSELKPEIFTSNVDNFWAEADMCIWNDFIWTKFACLFVDPEWNQDFFFVLFGWGEKKQQLFLPLVFLFSVWKAQASTEKKIKFEFVDSKEEPNVPYFDI